MLRYKINILDALKSAGYSTYRIRKEKIFGEAALQAFRRNECVVSSLSIETLCRILKMQPGDFIEYVEE